MSPDRLLAILIGTAIGGGGLIQGLHWRNTASAGSRSGDRERIAELENELAILQRENESLRSLAQGGGELAVPEPLVARVEKELALEFRSEPVVHRVPREVLAERIGANLESRHGADGLENREAAYKMIGWLRPNDSLHGQLIASRSVGARAWFDDLSGEAWVTDDHDPVSIPDQAALLRVLVRILLHQHFPAPPGYPGDERWRVHEALHGGTAAGTEARYYADNARAIGFMPMNNEASEGAELLLSLPPFLQGIATFPAIDGKGFTDSLYVRGTDRLLAALRNPPGDTRSILFPDLDPLADIGPPELPAADGRESLLEDRAGALGVRLLVDPLEDPALSRRCARAWSGDRWRLVAADDGAPDQLDWVVRFDDPATAAAFRQAARELAAVRAGLDSAPAGDSPITTPEGREIHFSHPQPGLVLLRNLPAR
jgi:hypothetical protein